MHSRAQRKQAWNVRVIARIAKRRQAAALQNVGAPTKSHPYFLYPSQNDGASNPSSAQLLRISSVISSQEFCVLHGGCVAGETCKHCFTNCSARAFPAACKQVLSVAFRSTSVVSSSDFARAAVATPTAKSALHP
jgi:hypothetical protein